MSFYHLCALSMAFKILMSNLLHFPQTNVDLSWEKDKIVLQPYTYMFSFSLTKIRILHRLENRTKPITTSHDGRCWWDSNLRTHTYGYKETCHKKRLAKHSNFELSVLCTDNVFMTTNILFTINPQNS